MKIFIATIAVLVVAVNADLEPSGNGAANFLITAQDLFNSLESVTYEEAVLSSNRTTNEQQRLADAIESFKTQILGLLQSFEDPEVKAVIERLGDLLAVVQDRMDQFDFGSQIIAAIVNLNNQIGVSVSSHIETFYSYLSSGGTAAHCFTDEIPRINEDASEVVASIVAALKKLIDDQSAEVDAWVEKTSDAFSRLQSSGSLSEIETTVTALVAEGLSSSFWLQHIADFKTATQAIVADAESKLELLRKDIDECA